MTLSGSSQYYFNTGVSGPIPNSSSSVFGSSPPDFKNFSNPNSSVETIVNVGHVGPTLKVENSPSNFGDETNMGVNSGGGGVNSGDLAKKKRGRPRKYGPDGANMSLALSPLSSNLSPGSEVERKNRGRPKGTGRKQRLASLGEWMNSSAGMAFTPHVIHIGVGEDAVGDGDTYHYCWHHYCWQRPEDMTTSRQAYKIDLNNPGSDLVGETAAAMAAASIVFRETNPQQAL